MATNYPSAKQTFTNPAAGSSVVSLSHAAQHATENDTIEAIQDAVGTTAGTNVLMSFAAGEFPVRVNSGGTMKTSIVLGTASNLILGTPAITGGTINSATFGTPTVAGGTVALSGTVVPLSFGGAIAPTVVSLTDPNDGGTVTPNAQAGQVFSLVIGTAGSRTIGNPANATTDGQVLLFRIKQNAGVTGTIAWGTNFKWNLGSAGTLGTSASKWNYFGFRANTTGTTFDQQGALVDVG